MKLKNVKDIELRRFLMTLYKFDENSMQATSYHDFYSDFNGVKFYHAPIYVADAKDIDFDLCFKLKKHSNKYYVKLDLITNTGGELDKLYNVDYFLVNYDEIRDVHFKNIIEKIKGLGFGEVKIMS